MVKHLNAPNELVLMEKDAIKRDQDGIKRDLNKLDSRIHANAIQCMLHTKTHGDTSLMARLLVDVLSTDSGYRTRGLINWMRKHSPMELKGNVITLSGILGSEADVTKMVKDFPDADKSLFQLGAKRPFLIDEANAKPFWKDADNAERVVRPVFQQGVVQKFRQGLSEFDKAMANTLNGQPVDPSKPFYDGKDADKVDDIFGKISDLIAQLPKDMTRDIRKAQEEVERLKSIENVDVKEDEPTPPEGERQVA